MIPSRLRHALIWLAWMPCCGIGAEPRVFYAPSERAAITADRASLHATGTLAPLRTEPAAPDAGASRAVAAPVPRLEGISLTRDGRAYAWIGGRRFENGSLYHGRRLQVTRDGVRTSAGAGRLLRVGEAIPATWRGESR